MAPVTQKSYRPEPRPAQKNVERGFQGVSRAEHNGVIKVCVAAWLIPGLGHFLLKKRIRGLILFLTILGMFVLGLLMHGTFFEFGSPSILERLGYIGELCAGLALPVANFFGYAGGSPFFASADYGTAYLVCAGMLNVLSILDAYDITLGRKA
jgi:hypothetical protein